MKIPLAESSVALAFLWATYMTFFFSVFPLVATSHRRVIFESYPCVVHVIFSWVIGFFWIFATIYTHHRMQVVADSRRCGVWEQLSPEGGDLGGNGGSAGKAAAWKSGGQYLRGDTVSFASRLYRLESPHSCYHLPPSAAASRGVWLRGRERLHGVLTKDSGPASRSSVLGALLGAMLAACAVMAGVALLFPRQVRVAWCHPLTLSSPALASHCHAYLSSSHILPTTKLIHVLYCSNSAGFCW
jgi:hypothetical protein